MRSVKLPLFQLTLLLSLSAAPFCLADEQGQEKVIKIGVNFGLTGAASRWAEHAKNGIELAKEQFNSDRQSDGYKLEILFEDNETVPVKAVTAYRKLVTIDKVDALIASNWSILTNPLIPLAKRDKVVMLAPTVMDVSLENPGANTFAFGPRAESIRPAVEEFYRLNPSVKSAVFLSWDDAWGHANAAVWREVTERVGVKILTEIWEEDYARDPREEAAKILVLKPDVVFVGMYADRVAARLRELKVRPLIFTTDCIHEAVADLGVSRELLSGMYYAEWTPNAEYVEAYKQRFDVLPLFESQNSYEAVRAIVKAYELGKGDVREGIRKVSYEGVAGRIDFSGEASPNAGTARLVKIK